MTRVRAAACQYPIERLKGWEAYQAKVGRWVAEAVSRGAQILVFPEYASLELASLPPASAARPLGEELPFLQTFHGRFLALHRDLARQCSVYLLAGSFPVLLEGGTYRNRAYLFAPDGAYGYQDKIQMTRFEAESWGVCGGRKLTVFDTPIGRLGVCICYDSEFPLLGRALAEAGAEVLLVPSCTDTCSGAHRVRIACQARALENQCYVVAAATVGEAPWSEAVDRNVGLAAVYGPPDFEFPEDGVIAAGPWNEPQWVVADLDLEKARTVRREGQVLLCRDWPGQHRALEGPVKVLPLGS